MRHQGSHDNMMHVQTLQLQHVQRKTVVIGCVLLLIVRLHQSFEFSVANSDKLLITWRLVRTLHYPLAKL